MELYEEIKELKKHLHYLKGQIEGIEKMIEREDNPNKIFAQFKALEGTLNKASYILLEDILRKELALKIVKVVDACPGNCEDAEKIKIAKKEFPNMEIKKVASIISEMDEIKRKLDKLNEIR